jgi:hypothetical protein
MYSIRKLLRPNVRSIKTNLGGCAIGHLSIILLIMAYAIITSEDPWENPEAPVRGPEEINEGKASQLAAERNHWEKVAVTFRTWTTVDQALKKQIITVFEPMYLEILNNDMVGFANTTAR